ncbi:MAG: hypothetical protein ISN29_02180 [Gammaproteobacteria bacterium AqS3]|nr:hypothetical protein [Gammaproteobacteria bacterium AqS3]
MRPDPGEVLFTLGQVLATETSTLPAEEYQQGRVRMMGIALLMAAEDIAKGAEKHLQQNRAMTVLMLRAVAGGQLDAGLKERLEEAAQSAPQDMTPAKLRTFNDLLRERLIELHEAAERTGLDELNDAIWDLLDAMTRSDRSELLEMIFAQEEATAAAAVAAAEAAG